MIKPTIGRKVHFYPCPGEYPDMIVHGTSDGYDQPLDATVVYVWNDRMVNLRVTDHAGDSHALTSIPLVQEEDDLIPNTSHCRWMPYQVGQAAKTEQLEKQQQEQKTG